MIIAMFLAHLVGDYVFQWDGLARWKSIEFRGVVVHSLILFVITALFALPYSPYWWGGVLFIGFFHFIVDGAQYFLKPTINPFLRFIIDQILHILTIIVALLLGGYLEWGHVWDGIVAGAYASPKMTAALGYVFITMPAWVLLKFLVYALVKGQPPNFPAGPNKFVGIAERLIITTLVLFGQVLLIPLVALPRLVMDWPNVANGGGDVVYLTELVSSIGLAVGVGMALSLLL
jgi:hypothetical protein